MHRFHVERLEPPGTPGDRPSVRLPVVFNRFHLCCTTYNVFIAASMTKRTRTPLPPFFRDTAVLRNSDITPASPLIRKYTTLRWTLWHSYCSMAKRPQFSCPLRTATAVPLKFENVVPGRWNFSSSYFCGHTPASPLFRKNTTLRWTHWYFHYSVAKRQQFSCPLRSKTTSPKFENGVSRR